MKKILTCLVIGCFILSFGVVIADQAKLVASKGSDKYHIPTCSTAAKITPANKVTFASKEEAEKAGYKPCQICCKNK